MLAEFSIMPMGRGESVSAQVAKIIRIVESSGLPYRLNPMGTVVEGEWDRVMALIRQCHESVLKDTPRVLTRISVDDRPGNPDRIHEKVRSVERHLGRKVEQ